MSIFSQQLIYFSENNYLFPENLDKETRKSRSLLIKSFIKLSNICSISAYKNIIDNQNFTYYSHNKNYQYNKEDEENRYFNFLRSSNDNIITYDKLPGGISFINKDKLSLSVVTNGNKITEEEKKILLLLWNSQNKMDKNENLIDYLNLSSKEYIERVKIYFNLHKEPNIPEDYIFTADNYFKMILIDIKANANIPILLMGETGCGKTYLIRMICQVYNIQLKILDVNAGTTENDIIKFMNDIIDKNKNNNNKIWIFFDEINTTTSIGLLSEIMCNRTMLGQDLPKKFIFLAACNPYREKIKKEKYYSLVYNKKNKNKNLVYNVLPLSHSLVNFVFDFGNLNDNDERKYIESMVTQANIEDKNLIKISIMLLSACQQYFRNHKEISSISLRNIRRFIILYSWFKNYFILKDSIIKFSREHKFKCIILSIYICYILSIPEKEKRDVLYSILANKLLNLKYDSYDSLHIKYILSNMIIRFSKYI